MAFLISTKTFTQTQDNSRYRLGKYLWNLFCESWHHQSRFNLTSAGDKPSSNSISISKPIILFRFTSIIHHVHTSHLSIPIQQQPQTPHHGNIPSPPSPLRQNLTKPPPQLPPPHPHNHNPQTPPHLPPPNPPLLLPLLLLTHHRHPHHPHPSRLRTDPISRAHGRRNPARRSESRGSGRVDPGTEGGWDGGGGGVGAVGGWWGGGVEG